MWDTAVSPSSTQQSNQRTSSDLPQESASTLDCNAIPTPCKKVLLSYNNSSAAEKALPVARRIAKEQGAKLIILGVSPLAPRPGVADLESRVDQARERFSKKFYKIRLAGMNEGLQIETLIALGDASELTWRSAERFHAHLIVVGCPEFREAPGGTDLEEKVSVVRVAAESRSVSGGKQMCLCAPSLSNQEIE